MKPSSWDKQLGLASPRGSAASQSDQTNNPSKNEVGLDVSHHARISQRGGEKLFYLTSFFIGPCVWPYAYATESFGFVYIHPFEDSNGRIHRFLVHHVLAKLGFTPTGVIFPISAAMLRDPGRYVNVLDIVSKSIRPFIQFTLDDDGRMTVTNETADLYRYLDVTAHAEYLYWCIDQTIQKDLREELDFLGFFDEALKATINVVDMPDGKASLLVKLIHQNGGRLSKTKRALFSELTDAEISQIEEAIRKASARI